MEENLKTKQRLQHFLTVTGATVVSVSRNIGVDNSSVAYFLKEKRLLVPEILDKINAYIDEVKDQIKDI